jgi:hypothetical protein
MVTHDKRLILKLEQLAMCIVSRKSVRLEMFGIINRICVCVKLESEAVKLAFVIIVLIVASTLSSILGTSEENVNPLAHCRDRHHAAF